MKLIIDIDENYYKAICKRVERFGRGSVILSTPEKVILNGTPLQEELESIKAEIIKIEFRSIATGKTKEEMTELIIKSLDKHINQADCNNDCEHCEWTECPKD